MPSNFMLTTYRLTTVPLIQSIDSRYSTELNSCCVSIIRPQRVPHRRPPSWFCITWLSLGSHTRTNNCRYFVSAGAWLLLSWPLPSSDYYKIFGHRAHFILFLIAGECDWIFWMGSQFHSSKFASLWNIYLGDCLHDLRFWLWYWNVYNESEVWEELL
jgi:hypothetical protein